MTRRHRPRVEAFIDFCIAYQIEVALILWLLIAIGVVILFRGLPQA